MNRRDSGPGRGAGGRGTASAAYPDDAYLDPAAYPVDPGYRGYSGGDRLRPADMPEEPRPRARHHATARRFFAAARQAARDTGGFSRVGPRQDDAPPAGARPRPRPGGGRPRPQSAGRSRPSGRDDIFIPNESWAPPSGRPAPPRGPRTGGVPGPAPGGPRPSGPAQGPAAGGPGRQGRPDLRHEQAPNAGYDADPGYAPSGQDRRQRPARAGRTPQAARSTVPAGASAVQSRVSGDTVRASQDPTGTAPMNTVLTSVAARMAASSTGLASTAPGSMGPASRVLNTTALASAGPGPTDLSSIIPASTDLTSTSREQYGPGQYGAGQYGPEQHHSAPSRPEQYGADQRGPEQYGPAQRGPGQYGPEQHHSGQSRPEQYGPEQYPPDQYGPGRYGADQYGPEQHRLRPARARSARARSARG